MNASKGHLIISKRTATAAHRLAPRRLRGIADEYAAGMSDGRREADVGESSIAYIQRRIREFVAKRRARAAVGRRGGGSAC